MRYYCSYPPSGDANPFFLLLENHLLQHQWKPRTFHFKTGKLFRNRKEVSILWFHWPSSHWRSSNKLMKILKAIRFFYHVQLASMLGYKMVWSAHNVLPHGFPNSKFELKLRKMFVKRMDLVVGHAKNTEAMLKEKSIFSKKYHMAIHGHYEDFYEKKSEELSRSSLDFSNSDIVLLLKSGGKNYEDAKRFYQFFSEKKYQNIKLLVVGNKFQAQENVTYLEGFLSNEQLASCLDICDYMVLPYEDITTSGAFFLALTFHKSVIAKKLDFFVQHTLENTAVLYEDQDELTSLLNAIDSGSLVINADNLSKMKSEYTWEKAAKTISKEFNNLLDT